MRLLTPSFLAHMRGCETRCLFYSLYSTWLLKLFFLSRSTETWPSKTSSVFAHMRRDCGNSLPCPAHILHGFWNSYLSAPLQPHIGRYVACTRTRLLTSTHFRLCAAISDIGFKEQIKPCKIPAPSFMCRERTRVRLQTAASAMVSVRMIRHSTF